MKDTGDIKFSYKYKSSYFIICSIGDIAGIMIIVHKIALPSWER